AREAPPAERQQGRSELEDRRLRPAEPLALLMGPRHARPLHRRRRPGRVGRGRRADAEAAALPEQLRLAGVGGPRALHLRAAGELYATSLDGQVYKLTR